MLIKMLNEAISPLLKPLKQIAEKGFEGSLEKGEFWECVPMIISYCSKVSEAKILPAPLHGAGGQHPCVRRQSTYENMIMGRKRSTRVVAETMETESGV